ncbi:probable cytochrome P450 CYP44 [Planococcus citri]|uniref:probable cytochrome P450 CYP44 n=1 Tax=Planococcus citri TaxID=170843 RepID=UPI0031F99D43
MRNRIFRSIYTEAVDHVKPFESIPRPFQLPFVGNWHLYKLGIYNPRKYHQVLSNLYKKYGPVVYEKVGLDEPLIHIFEPEDVQTVYRNEDKLPEIFPLNKFARDYRKREDYSAGLGNTNGDEWYRFRNGIRDFMMKTKCVQGFLKETETVTDDLIEIMKKESADNEGRIVDLRQLLGRWSIEVAGEICFNKRLGYLCGPNEALGRKMVQANKTVFRTGALLKFALPFYNYVRTPKWTRQVECEHLIHGTALEHANEAFSKIDQLMKSNSLKDGQYKFLITLLQKDELSRRDVATLSISLFGDGLSTIVPVLITMLYCLATNPRVQEKAYEEICRVTGDKDQNLDAGIVNQLTYLKAIMKETFRMYPNGVEIARIIKKPLILSNYHIPAKSNLSMNMQIHFKSPKYFSDPEVFKPERWIRGSKDSNVHPFLFAPFGVGARTCDGRKFAEKDLHVSLFKILKNFKLVYPPDGPCIDFVFDTLLFPDKDLPIRFLPR